ncbi:hypothetical protein [Methylobacterium iners]|uniref:Uncharacterized protein n=1 Tax=Methylobacterium iners TaxID=418707 RepID=A0ABQ4RSM0_9HYPH|nr:hypothetical protein [Methylobacterium iners]GJD93776.1 hypothetical protein OCOJLMKI_0973 [Methylobacterium iners]
MRPPADGFATDAIEVLTERLLSGHSATAVLEAWCLERGFAGSPPIRARPVPGPERAATTIQRDRLDVGPEEAIGYRRVRLTFGGLVLSEAENWYVPSRLTPAMNAVLAQTDAPFGHVVHALAPTRRNLSFRALRPEDGTLPGPDEALLAIDAVLSSAEGVPFCEVAEIYLGAVLGPGSSGG